MRRTYRSKKDTGGGVDHRDMVLSVDSKSSIFDAYYIQNIKQVKREMSYVGTSNPYTAASFKARKRKYVKRLKEPEPVRESLSESAYLTPDKSIHVNRTPDLFDQLLNSSTNLSPVKSSASHSIRNKRPGNAGKTYVRKKPTKYKKINHSSSEEMDSDKENSPSDDSHPSNVKAHKLVIEKERLSSSLHLDESIDRVVKKFSVFDKLSKEFTNMSSDRNVRFSKVAFNVTESPLMPTSPQCSTPFNEKYRGKSIYNFSPIKLNLMNEPSNLTSTKDNIINNSVICVEENYNNSSNNIKENVSKTNSEAIDVNNSIPYLNLLQDKQDCELIQTSNHTIQNYNANDLLQKNMEVYDRSDEMDLLHTSELEPFLGFSHNSGPQSIKSDFQSPRESSASECSVNSQIGEVLSKHSIHRSIDDINSTSDGSQQYNDETNITCIDDEVNEKCDSVSEYSEGESLYDTCDSETMSDTCNLNKSKPKEPIVIMERLNDSVFQKYYDKIADFSIKTENSTNNSSDSISDSEICSSNYESDYSSLIDHQEKMTNNSTENYSDNNESYNENLEMVDTDLIISPSENEDTITNEIEEEDKCISFVTTRRRKDVTNDSFLLNLDNSYNSNSSATLDKTVLSNNKERLETELSLEEKTLINDIETEEETDCNLHLVSNEKLVNPLDLVQIVSDDEITCVSTRKSSRLFRDSTSSYLENRRDTTCGLKQGIVLKPGKKWERSLSIYRRMTIMGDTFDQSILDEESLKSKGRKYRQSVVSTMEMQESQGSLHNESIYSRRSTFVSKPCRSTIKIFKDPNASRISLSSSVLYDDLEGLLNGDCDDTVIELSKLSISDSEHEVTVLDKFHDTSSRILTARDYVLRRCNQTESLLFDECYPETVLKNCRKIGEGVYGEVFLWRAGDGRARVMKVVPIAGTVRVNGEVQKDYHEIISEIVIAMELSALRAPIAEIERQLDDGKQIDALDLQSVQNATDVFNEVLKIRCVHGAYPSRLLDLWELYDECNGSENDSPAALPPDQRYVVLELANAGQDLESYRFSGAEQAYALFKQIALGLAVAEEAFQFEHRDLHWGNVLIAPTDQKYATFVLRGRLYRVPRAGVAATLIDYSLSRAARAGRALYNDLAADEALFAAVGDYQFEVYRLMRDKLGNDWKNYEPYTNILWLHYTLDKMITALRYTRTNTKIHKHYIAKLKEIKNRILDYGSATEFILTDNEF